MNSEYIISYEQGYNDWYVSEFYKYFHNSIQSKLNINLTYEPISLFANRFNHVLDNNSDSLFNWFNLILYNKNTEKFFVHSWYDYSNATIEWCNKRQLNIVKFSAVSNISKFLIDKYSYVCPSVYYLENWSDHDLISNFNNNIKNYEQIYFAGMAHGIRENILNVLKQYDNFNIYIKPHTIKQKKDYYNELSQHLYGLSLNGAANICYRDLELFGLKVLNLRSPFESNTHNPLLENIHYINFIDENITNKILNYQNIDIEILNKIEEIRNLQYKENIIQNAYEWYVDNCLPINQFNIIFNFLEELTILQ